MNGPSILVEHGYIELDDIDAGFERRLWASIDGRLLRSQRHCEARDDGRT
jgi:hypothetical protein